MHAQPIATGNYVSSGNYQSFSTVLTDMIREKANSTGTLALDAALGTGGFTFGRMVEVSGDTGTGKTTLALHAVAACQQQGGVAAFFDPEFALDLSYARKLGVDVSSLLFSQPKTAEQTFDTAETLIKSGTVRVLVIDSIAALLPKSHLDAPTTGTDTSALEHSRILADGFCKLRIALRETKCTVIFTNQLRMKQVTATEFEATSIGGRPVANFMATRVRLLHGNDIRCRGRVTGHHCEMSVIKHKDGKSGGRGSTPIIYQSGMALSYETLVTGIRTGLVQRNASGFYALGHRLGATGIQAKLLLDKKPTLRIMINTKLLNASFVLQRGSENQENQRNN
ncbi:recombination protein RecA [Vibrio crassostreae]|nr:putative Protein RecA [Vibrio chagasii]CAK2846467.1 recombination protein RecA [Vibrio crassostreae]